VAETPTSFTQTRSAARWSHRSVTLNRHYRQHFLPLFGRMMGAESIRCEGSKASEERVSMEKGERR
jgi:hypothetical protein